MIVVLPPYIYSDHPILTMTKLISYSNWTIKSALDNIICLFPTAHNNYLKIKNKSFFHHFASLNGKYLENIWSDFQFFFKCAEFYYESLICIQIFDISNGVLTKHEKLIRVPGNHEIGNTAKFWPDGIKS